MGNRHVGRAWARGFLLCSAAGVALAMPSLAAAQDAPQAAEPAGAPADAAPADQGAGSGNEIIVTATKREQTLQDVPVAGGAYLLRVGASAEDLANATATSESRRRLVAEGSYTPTKYALVWPRRALSGWTAP